MFVVVVGVVWEKELCNLMWDISQKCYFMFLPILLHLGRAQRDIGLICVIEEYNFGYQSWKLGY